MRPPYAIHPAAWQEMQDAQDFPMALMYANSEEQGIILLALAHQAKKPNTYTNRLI